MPDSNASLFMILKSIIYNFNIKITIIPAINDNILELIRVCFPKNISKTPIKINANRIKGLKFFSKEIEKNVIATPIPINKNGENFINFILYLKF
jgi:hypothetical protein